VAVAAGQARARGEDRARLGERQQAAVVERGARLGHRGADVAALAVGRHAVLVPRRLGADG
jgi:hypothetical protein